MTADRAWVPAEPDCATIARQFPRPLDALAGGEVPALVVRGAYPPEKCRQMVRQMTEQRLLYDPAKPVPQDFLKQAIPEGYYREGRDKSYQDWQNITEASGRRRIDIGTSLGYRGSDPPDFFQHAEKTNELFASLFSEEDLIGLCYNHLEQLANAPATGGAATGGAASDSAAGKHVVVTAREPDGRLYGPAIIRAHYGGYTYRPHFDSVRLREKRTDFAVYEFDHQFAGVLVLQNAHAQGRTAQCIIHQCLWQPDINPHIEQDTFHDYAAEHKIANVEVQLEPGDLYFFNTRCIHEVPGVAGDLPRIVLAMFIGYSSHRDEIFVWS